MGSEILQQFVPTVAECKNWIFFLSILLAVAGVLGMVYGLLDFIVEPRLAKRGER